ncbi:hypothetical protein HGI30_14985 [Paenibacillus albicereus]|uniref:Uncharacterized protein n=1 Tax=Paenibacillus albicereus TaxID=2726185 RepID=A0A6H2GZB7_9BACL|nr:hypothetical protein [Paenibacillus albicereus]QJC52737.1 hypothetical protein HGI30_14985 [Paenibacillus albicereus]
MADVIDSFGSNGICAVCKRNPVNRWCDYVVDYSNPLTFFRDYKDFIEANRGDKYETCDLPICDKCATNVGKDRDLCPHHMGLHGKAQLPDEYQRQRQGRERAKIYTAERP